jgi:replicative DNA helicase
VGSPVERVTPVQICTGVRARPAPVRRPGASLGSSNFVRCDETDIDDSPQSACVSLQPPDEVPSLPRGSENGHSYTKRQTRSVLATLAELHQQTETVENSVLPTGFGLLDDVLAGGVRQGEIILLGGKPGVGKTVAALQWARSIVQHGTVAIYVCFEHDEVTLVTRLLSCELGELIAAAGPDGSEFRYDELQARIRDVADGSITLREAIDSDGLIHEAHRRLACYADRLVLVTGSGQTDVNAIGDVTREFERQPVALFVDYIQRVAVVPAVRREAERVGRVVEDLKQLALDQKLAVIAITAADQLGLDARRLHLRHFRGSTALAYEADAVVVLNEKLAVVSRTHLAYSPTRAEEFKRQVVFSIEKNRNGSPDIDLEFEKDFGHYRFHPRGRWVAERLWTEGSVEL